MYLNYKWWYPTLLLFFKLQPPPLSLVYKPTLTCISCCLETFFSQEVTSLNIPLLASIRIGSRHTVREWKPKTSESVTFDIRWWQPSSGLYKSEFFLKATLWPDFTELFFWFFGSNRWWFSPVNFGCFWCQKKTISKLSGNTVRSTHKSSESFIRYFTFHWKLN